MIGGTMPDAGAGGTCLSSVASDCVPTGGGSAPETDPESERLPHFGGAQCTNNAPMDGLCASAGDQCTYNTVAQTHYCTCLRFAPTTPGMQGWSCR